MDILISNTSDKPIYSQICEQIRSMIISGRLKEGDSLPSMRLLAKELRISVITTKRAYDELEKDGLITSVTGKGSFVAGVNRQLIQEEHLRQIEQHMTQIMELAKVCNLSIEDLQEMMTLLFFQEKQK